MRILGRCASKITSLGGIQDFPNGPRMYITWLPREGLEFGKRQISQEPHQALFYEHEGWGTTDNELTTHPRRKKCRQMREKRERRQGTSQNERKGTTVIPISIST